MNSPPAHAPISRFGLASILVTALVACAFGASAAALPPLVEPLTQVVDIGFGSACVTDTFGSGCAGRVFPGQRWQVNLYVYNFSAKPISDWSLDIDLVNEGTGERTPLATQVSGDPLSEYGAAYIRWRSSVVFTESQKGTAWRVEASVAVKDSINPEPPDRLSNNHTLWSFQVQNPISDIGITSPCVMDSLGRGCLNRVFPGQRWRLSFSVYNNGERRLDNWSFNVELVNLATSERIPVASQVSGDSLPLYDFRNVNWLSPYVFNESQKISDWRVEVTAAVKDSAHPEPPERQTNNRGTAIFHVENPGSDIVLSFKCITDSLGYFCRDRVFPGTHWYVTFDVYNQGDVPIHDWRFDIDMVDLGTGERISLANQVQGDSLPLGGYAHVRWPSPLVFDESRKGSHWRMEMNVSVRDTITPEPPDHQSNNRATWSFEVDNPFYDLAVVFKCVTDTIRYGCTDRIFPGLPWRASFEVYNQGERQIDEWSFNIDLINPRNGDRIPLATQVSRGPLLVGNFDQVQWPSPYVFGQSDRASAWRVEVSVVVKDSSRPEPPERLANNRSEWVFQVVNPVTDIGTSYGCVADTFGYCRNRVFPGQPWSVAFNVYNGGERSIDAWSYDITLVNEETVESIPLATQVSGAALPYGGSTYIRWPSWYVFNESQKSGAWRVDVNLAVKDSSNLEPPDRRLNNRLTSRFVVENPISDIAISSLCVTDLVGSGCLSRLFPGRSWRLIFGVYNNGERRLDSWSFAVDLVREGTGERIPLAAQVPGDSLPVGAFTQVDWTSPYVFDESFKGSQWLVEVNLAVKDSTRPEPPDRLFNNRAQSLIRVQNPSADLGISFKCVTDSLGYNCRSRMFPSERWTVSFDAYNSGDIAIESWSFDVDLVNQGTGERVTLATGVDGGRLARGASTRMRWPSPYVFDDSQKGSDWRVELTVAVRDSGHPEPPDRQSNNRAAWTLHVDHPIPDIRALFKCVMDSAGFNCVNRVFPGQAWRLSFDVYNQGERRIGRWSFDIDLINQVTNARIPIATQVIRDSLPLGSYAHVDWPSGYVFHEDQKATDWRVELTVAVRDSGNLEPPDRQTDNRTTWFFRVENRVSDIGMSSVCVTDSMGNCIYRVFPGKPWSVSFGVYNKGDRAIGSWSYDIDMIRSTGERIPLVSQVFGDSLPLSAYRNVLWRSPSVFDETEKGDSLIIEVRAAVRDSSSPEPPERQINNRASWAFRIENPVSDIGVAFKCVMDSLRFYCLDRVAIGQPWRVVFGVYNQGDFPIDHWSFDVDLINEGSGERIPLATQVNRDSLQLFGFVQLEWPSPYLFSESQKGSIWRVELNLAVKDSARPEPPERQFNNRAFAVVRVENPVSDIMVAFKCVMDSLRITCLNLVPPGQHWNASFEVANNGDKPLEHWTYDLDLLNQGTGERIPLEHQVPGEPIPLRGSVHVDRLSAYVFEESQKGSEWRVELSVAVTDTTSPEPPERRFNNFASWYLRVENPVSDIGVYACVTDTSKSYCLGEVAPGQPWHVTLYAYNKGTKPINQWAYSIDLIREETGERTELATLVPGDSIPLAGSALLNWVSSYRFSEEQKGSVWRVDVTVAVTDSSSLEPPERRFNDQASWRFLIRNAGSDLAITSLCVADSAKICVGDHPVHSIRHTLFRVVNLGNRPVEHWSFDIDLKRVGGDSIPLERHVAGQWLGLGAEVTINWPTPHEFSDSDQGDWEMIVTLAVEDTTLPDTSRANNRRSVRFVVEGPTATLLSLFQVEPVAEGLELRWQFTEPGEIATVELERGETSAGPWSRVAAEPGASGNPAVLLDRNVESGRTYYYRLVVRTRGGEVRVFGPLAGTVGTAIADFALTGVAPNPGRGPIRIEFTVAREAPVRLSVVDIQGREVAVLASGRQRPGRHQAVWSGLTTLGAAPAGLYFVRYQTPEAVSTRRLALMR